MLVICCDFAELFICNNVFMLCNKYNTCILTRGLMYYTIFIVAVPYSLDLFKQNLHVTFAHLIVTFNSSV